MPGEEIWSDRYFAAASFSNDTRSAGRARKFISRTCAVAPGGPHPIEELTLAVSELVTNACQHTDGVCTVSVLWVKGVLQYIEVEDLAPGTVRSRRATAADESGRGLEIVEYLGVIRVRRSDAGGKIIRVVFNNAPQPADEVRTMAGTVAA